jgi:hypothetical protein
MLQIIEFLDLKYVEESDDDENGKRIFSLRKPSFLKDYPAIERVLTHMETESVKGFKLKRSVKEVSMSGNSNVKRLLETFVSPAPPPAAN